MPERIASPEEMKRERGGRCEERRRCKEGGRKK
jgi:hypothetical protein